MFVGGELFSTRQDANELFGFVDQDGEMLRADPILAILVGQCEQGDFLAALAADHTYGCLVIHNGLPPENKLNYNILYLNSRDIPPGLRFGRVFMLQTSEIFVMINP